MVLENTMPDDPQIPDIPAVSKVIPEALQVIEDAKKPDLEKPLLEADIKQEPAKVALPVAAPAQMLVAAAPATSYFDLLKAVVVDQTLSGEQKKILLEQLKGSSPTSDRLTYRLAIWILGFIALVTIVAIWHLTSQPNALKVPDGLIAIASGAVGGLAGLLSPARGADTHA